jgi:hypothetical protein
VRAFVADPVVRAASMLGKATMRVVYDLDRFRARRSAALCRRIPREARDGLMRVWLGILRERHPDVTWVAVAEAASREDHPSTAMPESPAAVAA